MHGGVPCGAGLMTTGRLSKPTQMWTQSSRLNHSSERSVLPSCHQLRLRHMAAGSQTARHINNTSSIVTAALALLIILKVMLRQTAMPPRRCDYQSAVGQLIHAAALIDRGSTLLLCLHGEAVDLILNSPPFCPPPPACGRAHSHLQLLFGDQGAEPRQEARGAHLLR